MDNYVCYIGKVNDKDCDIACKDCANYGKDRRVAERRQRGVSFRLWERREGFDRRLNSEKNKGLYRRVFRRGAFYLRHNYRSLIVLLLLFNLFNAADYIFTLRALAAGVAEEGNPLMDKLFDMGPAAAFIFKVAVGLFITSIVWLLKRYRLVLEVSILILLMYMLLISYHIYGMVRYY
ncbi:MAG TPA: DUF5658 family protein [Anaerolineae bacterium]|nr:DUF5658 family protein [Anaerolineae bacterium]